MNACHNVIRRDYGIKDAVEDLELAIKAAETQRNKESSRTRGRFQIDRKW